MKRIIDLGKLRFNFRGEWMEGTEYEINDLVSYGACLYLYHFAIKESGHKPIDTEYWQLMVSGFRHRGALVPGEHYALGDVVADGASSRVALGAFQSSGSFVTDGVTKWGLVALGNATVPDPVDKADGLTAVTKGGTYVLQAPRDRAAFVKAGEQIVAVDGQEIHTDTRNGSVEILLPPNPQGGEKVVIYDAAASWEGHPAMLRRNNANRKIDDKASDYALDGGFAVVTVIYINNDLQWRTQ